jgi:putative transposase
MPSRNVVKTYVTDAWYHLYNRGVNKQPIFHEPSDYFYFLKILKNYLSPENRLNQITGLVDPMNLSSEIQLVSFTLMPNHYHLLVKQFSQNGITHLTQRILTTYVKFFNRKYPRIGPLFEGKLKGILVETDSYLLHLSRYIHRNCLSLDPEIIIEDYAYSSYPYYIGKKHASWLNVDLILNYFYSNRTDKPSLASTYKEFTEYKNDNSDLVGSIYAIE